MNSVVDCFSYKFNKWSDIDISTHFDVYPCCAYHGAVYKSKDFEDPRLNNLPENWNNLKYNSLENILNQYSKIINEENWQDEKTCPAICLRFCGKKNIGQRQTYHANLDVENKLNQMTLRELQKMSSVILSKEKSTSSFIKQFKADHDSQQFYKNVIKWYVQEYNEFPWHV